jgi:hypothetical protein
VLGVVIKTVPAPDPAAAGVPDGAGAGGADGARAAATEAAPEKVDAQPVPPPPLIDPAEALIGISKLATSIFTVVYCRANEVEWDPALGEWSAKEEEGMRVSAAGAAHVLGPLFAQYAAWIALGMYSLGLFDILNKRVYVVKKYAPKEAKATVKDPKPEKKEEYVKEQPQPNGDVPVRLNAGPVPGSFWESNPNG